MSKWRSSKAKQVLAALLRIGWTIKRQVGSHQLLERAGWADYVFAFHDREEIGPKAVERIPESSKHKTPDVLVSADGERFVVVVRAKERDEQLLDLVEHPLLTAERQ